MALTSRKSTLSYIAFIVLFINLSNLSPFVESSEIQDICNKTPYPNDCMECLAKRIPRPLRDYAQLTMECTNIFSTSVQHTFVELAAKSEDPAVKAAYGECSSRMSNFGSKISGAMTFWGDKKDDEAKKAMNDAQVEYDSCEHGLIKVSLPFGVEDMLKSVDYRLKDAFAIALLSEKKNVRHGRW